MNKSAQFLWPTHCVQNTTGAKFVREINQNAWTAVIQKETGGTPESYSAFAKCNDASKSTLLNTRLLLVYAFITTPTNKFENFVVHTFPASTVVSTPRCVDVFCELPGKHD